MLAIALTAVFAAVVGLSWTLKAHVRPAIPALQSDAVALNMLVYDRAAAEFAIADKTFEGEILPTHLSLPGWYNNLGGWRSEVKDGFMITYKTSEIRFSPDVVDALVHHTDAQMMVGKFSGNDAEFTAISPCAGLRSAQGNCPNAPSFISLIGRRASNGSPLVLRKVHP
jgi:hypothetical protein